MIFIPIGIIALSVGLGKLLSEVCGLRRRLEKLEREVAKDFHERGKVL